MKHQVKKAKSLLIPTDLAIVTNTLDALLSKGTDLEKRYLEQLSLMPDDTTDASDTSTAHQAYLSAISSYLTTHHLDLKAPPQDTFQKFQKAIKVNPKARKSTTRASIEAEHLRVNSRRRRKRNSLMTIDSTNRPDMLRNRLASLRYNKKRRVRRQIVGVVALGVASAALGTAGYALHRSELAMDGVRRLQAVVATQGKLEDTLHKQVVLQGTAIRDLQEKTEKRYEKVIELATEISDEADAAKRAHLLNSLIEHFKDTYLDLSDKLIELHLTLEEAKDHRLSNLLTDTKTVKATFKAATEQAARAGLLLVDKHFTAVYKSPTDFISIEGKMYFIIHLATRQDNLRLRVYKYRNQPLKAGGLKITLNSPPTYLIMDEHSSLSKKLTTEQFEGCSKIADIYHCSDIPSIFNKGDVESNCMIGLYQNKIDSIKKYCGYTVTKDDMEDIFQVNTHKFLVTASHDTTTNVHRTCRDSSEAKNYVIPPKESQIVLLSHDCSASTEHRVWYPGRLIQTKGSISASRPLTIGTEQLMDILKEKPEKSHLRKIIDQLKAIKPSQKISMDDYIKEYNSIKNTLHRKLYHHRVELGLGVLFIAVVLTVFLYGTCRFFAYRYFRRHGKAPPFPLSLFHLKGPMMRGPQKNEDVENQPLRNTKQLKAIAPYPPSSPIIKDTYYN